MAACPYSARRTRPALPGARRPAPSGGLCSRLPWVHGHLRSQGSLLKCWPITAHCAYLKFYSRGPVHRIKSTLQTIFPSEPTFLYPPYFLPLASHLGLLSVLQACQVGYRLRASALPFLQLGRPSPQSWQRRLLLIQVNSSATPERPAPVHSLKHLCPLTVYHATSVFSRVPLRNHSYLICGPFQQKNK